MHLLPHFVPFPWGIALILIGLLYTLKPDIFRRGIWKQTSIAQRLLSPTGYIKYMQGFGISLILIGSTLLFLDWRGFFE
jgi:hypothetical protein